MLDWNTIRAMWVNGEKLEAQNAIASLDSQQLLSVLRQAISISNKLNNQTGDLFDLFELLSSVVNSNIH
jgi:hypothetical protein